MMLSTPNREDKAAQKEKQIINYLATVPIGHPSSSGALQSPMHSSSQQPCKDNQLFIGGAKGLGRLTVSVHSSCSSV